LDNPRPDLKDLIIVQYAPLVDRLAKRFSGSEPVEDLAQVGYIGLLNALSRFDPSAGVRFNTYATHLVAGEIKHYLRDRTQTIRHPAWLQELRHQVTKAASSLQSDLGRVPTELEIAEKIGSSEEAVREVLATKDMSKVASLDSKFGEDEDGDSEIDRLESLVDREPLSTEDKMVLEAAIRQLRDLEREVLIRFHFDSLNQTEIANELGISCNYVSHILRQSLSKLRRILNTEEVENERLEAAMGGERDAVIDPNTGVYNQMYFENRLDEELNRAASNEEDLGVVRVRFEGLQNLESFYGPSSVRDLLADAAEFLKSAVRRLDIVCRYEQDGFAILLPATGPQVSIVRKRLNHQLGRWLNGRIAPSGPIHVEIGAAYYPEEGITSADLIERAGFADPSEREGLEQAA
jgi:RNA polymerase sigma-B factor